MMELVAGLGIHRTDREDDSKRTFALASCIGEICERYISHDVIYCHRKVMLN